MTYHVAGLPSDGEGLAGLSSPNTERGAVPTTPEQTVSPFLIRGHHVLFFAAFTRIPPGSFLPSLSCHQVADVITENYRNDQLNAMERSDYLQSAEYKYATDVIGEDTRQRLQYNQRIRNLFAAFERLPDSHPVKLGAVRDEICQACIFGKHCTISDDTYGSLASTRLKRDVAVVKQFIGVAARHGLAEKIVVLEEVTDYEDRESQPIPAVLTSAGVFRVLIHESYNNGSSFGLHDA